MYITRIRIQNFRSIKDAQISVSPTTVFIGPNNAGKTAILDAVRIALTRRWGQRGTGFTEHDVYLSDGKADPKTAEPIEVEVELQELAPGEWPGNLQTDLDEVIQIDARTGRSFIILRVTCAYNPDTRGFEPRWEFLGADRQPLAGRAVRIVNLLEFFQYVPVFYLSALRDASDEFSARSQFWGRLLRAMEIPDHLQARAQRVLDRLNSRLLAADPRLTTVADSLKSVAQISQTEDPGDLDLRAVPLKAWDLLARTEVIFKAEGGKPWLPLMNHGQGVQSLAVIFLFDAFVRHLLRELYKPDSTAILALEEPETHLHPQATRTLCSTVLQLTGQKLITTHSPYFVQSVPFRDLRLVRLTPSGTKVTWLPPYFSEEIPYVAGIDDVVAHRPAVLRYERTTETLTVMGKLEAESYRRLLHCFSAHAERAAVHARLRALAERSVLLISDEELGQLETFARRIRGEILFARKWLLVEGQCEYLLVHSLGTALGYDLNEHGVTVIDFQNNGNPGLFAALARAFGVPWVAIVDGDKAGKEYLKQMRRRGFSDKEIAQRCSCLPLGNLEQELVGHGPQPELRTILRNLGQVDADTLSVEQLTERLHQCNTEYIIALCELLKKDAGLAARMPEAFKAVVERVQKVTE